MKKKKEHSVNMDRIIVINSNATITSDFSYITLDFGNANLVRDVNKGLFFPIDTYNLFNLENAFTKYTRVINSFPKNASANDRIKFKVLLNNQKPEITKIKEQYKRYNKDPLINLSQPEINQIEIYIAIMDKFTKHVKGYISTVNYYHITNNSIEIINLYITTKSLKYVTDLEKSIEFLQSTEPENVSQTIFNFRSQALAASMFRTTLSEYLSEVHKNRLLFDNYYSFKYSIVPIMILSLIIYIVILTFFIFSFFHYNYIQ